MTDEIKILDDVPMKHWLIDEAQRHGVGTSAIFKWYQAGRYSHLTFRHVNQRVIFVSGPDIKITKPTRTYNRTPILTT